MGFITGGALATLKVLTSCEVVAVPCTWEARMAPDTTAVCGWFGYDELETVWITAWLGRASATAASFTAV